MKKVLLLTVVALFVMIPFASLAKTALSDSDMSAVTAQEGVSIYMNTTVSQFSMVASWGQSNISSITGSPIPNFAFDKGGFTGVDISVGKTTVTGLLTIDVGVNNSTTTAASGIPGGVELGLKDIALSQGPTQVLVKFGSEETLTNPATTMTLGTSYMNNLNVTYNGQVIICTH